MIVLTFYAKHLQALKDAGIMNNISDPNATEMRGWVMLMLQRAAENVNPSECNDPAVLLACSLGSDSCPAACVKNADEKSDDEGKTPSNISDMPIAGDLTIAVADYSSSVKSAPRIGTVVFNAVDFKASEKITIESVKLERTGLSSKSDIKGVWFEKDGVAVSAKASLSSDGTVTTRFYNNFSVNGTETLDLVAELNADAGSEIAFKIIGSVTTAKNVSLNTETTTYRTTNYDVAKVNFKYSGSKAAVTYKIGEKKSYEIGKFQISNENSSSEDKAVVLKSLKLRNSGNGDIATLLKNVYVTKDSKTVSKRVDIESKDLIIYFDNDELASGKRGIYTIYAEVASLDRVGDDVKLELRKNSELVANEVSTNFRVAYHEDMEKTPENLTLAQYIFNGGKTTFSNASDYAKTVEAAASSTDVEIAKGTLTVAESIKLEGLTIGATMTTAPAGTYKCKVEWEEVDCGGDDAKIAAIKSHIKDLKVEIGGSTYNTKIVDCDVEYPINGEKDDEVDYSAAPNSLVCYQVSDEMYVSKTSDVKVIVNLGGDENKDTITFTNIKWTSFTKVGEYDETGSKLYPADMAGSVQVAKLTVKPGKFTITNKSSSNQKVVVNSTDEVSIFSGEISSNKGKVSVNSLTLTDTTSLGDDKKLADADQITLTLYVNGEPFADEILTNKSIKSVKINGVAENHYQVSFANLGDLSSDVAMKIEIKAQPNASIANNDFTFKVQATGSDGNGNDVESSSANTAKLSITESATISASNSSAKSEVVKEGSDAELVSFTSTVKNGNYNLNTVKLTLDGVSDVRTLDEISLYIDGKSVESNSVTAVEAVWEPGEDGYVPASFLLTLNTNESLSAGKHTFAFKSNLNVANSAAAGDVLTNTIKVSKVELNGEQDQDEWAVVEFNTTKLVVKAIPTLSSRVSGDDLIITVTNSDKEEDITIQWFGIVGNVVTASFNDKTIALPDFNTAVASLTLAPGESVELQLQAAKQSTVQVTAIKVDGVIISSQYTNVGKWTNFKVTPSGDGTSATYYTFNAAAWAISVDPTPNNA